MHEVVYTSFCMCLTFSQGWYWPLALLPTWSTDTLLTWLWLSWRISLSAPSQSPALRGLELPSEGDQSQAQASGCLALIPHQLSDPISMGCIGIGGRTCHWIKQESIVKLYFLFFLISFGLGEKVPLLMENLVRSWKLVLSPWLLMLLMSSLLF